MDKGGAIKESLDGEHKGDGDTTAETPERISARFIPCRRHTLHEGRAGATLLDIQEKGLMKQVFVPEPTPASEGATGQRSVAPLAVSHFQQGDGHLIRHGGTIPP